MSVSLGEVQALRARLELIPKQKKTSLKTVFGFLLDQLVSDPQTPASAYNSLHKCIDSIINDARTIKITAGDATIEEITSIFGLSLPRKEVWLLADENLVDPPPKLSMFLDDFEDAMYDECEASRRIGIDIIWIHCRRYLRAKYRKTETNVSSQPTTPVKGTSSPKIVCMYPEASISVELPNLSVADGKIIVSGRADWAAGYSPCAEEGALLVAIEAKRKSEFSSGEAQLLTYLAILREQRRKNGKENIATQGFYGDSQRFAFLCIKNDGTVLQSPTYDIRQPSTLRTVFSFIVTLLETAMKSTPTVTPTKPGPQQEKEIVDFENMVWGKSFQEMKDAITEDDDMTDVYLFPTREQLEPSGH